ncbi:hypothetical protein DPMN_137859 [Dreissena polymorpha]|uniref:Uncharacterized protein n=1 Tax=Dreissena polymorpha TaxID=45954 RepID=A0A9D4G690_DREPO|nr:hypothetical protein DPMN_137859 [Dreissena polymorpha]
MRPNSGESTIEYSARLRENALSCNFVDIDDCILEHLVQTTSNSEFVRKVLHKQWTLQEALSDAQIHEDTSVQIGAMGLQERHIARVSKKKKSFTAASDSRNDRGLNCINCDMKRPFQKEKCPVYGKKV